MNKPTTKTCPGCGKEVVLEHPAQKYHPLCSFEAIKQRNKERSKHA